MVKKIFKSRANNGVLVKYVIYLSKGDDDLEPSLLIRVFHLVPIDLIETYHEINSIIPTYFTLRETNNYCLFLSQPQPIKISTLDKINELAKSFLNGN